MSSVEFDKTSSATSGTGASETCGKNISSNININGTSGTSQSSSCLSGIDHHRSGITTGNSNSMDIVSSPANQPYGHGGSEREAGDPNMESQSQQTQDSARDRDRDHLRDRDRDRERDRDRDRLHLTDQELRDASKERLIDVYYQLQKYVDGIQQKSQDEIFQLRESEEKLRAQHVESSRRENVLVMRLTMKEHEVQEYASQLNELKSMMIPSTGTLRSTLLDPAVNLLILRMKKELEDTKKKLEDTQNDLNAWKFTPDSNTGKRLMAKCRMLYQENEELGKMITSGRVAKLETDLALQKSLTEEMRKAQAEMDDVVQELDEDIDGMQSTICFWQEQLKVRQQEIPIPASIVIEPPPSSQQQPPPPTRHHHHHHHTSSSSSPPLIVSKDKDFQPEEQEAEVDVASTSGDGGDSELEPLEIDVGDQDEPSSVPAGPGTGGSGSGDSSSDSFTPIRTRSAPLNVNATTASAASINKIVLSESDTNPLVSNSSTRSLNTSSSMDGISDGDDEEVNI